MADFSLGAWNPNLDTLPNMFDTSLAVATESTPYYGNTVDTVPTNALQSMQPVSQAQAESWSGFWQDLTRGVVQYGIARDAAQNGITVRNTAPGQPVVLRQQQQAQQANGLVMLLLVGGLAYAVAK